jgi:hypothetical protein
MTLPDLIAVEDLFKLSERSGASISPDGTRIAFLALSATGSTFGSPTSTPIPSPGV